MAADHVLDDLGRGDCWMKARDWTLADQSRLTFAFEGSSPPTKARPADPKIRAGLPHVADLLGVVQHLLLASDVLLSLGYIRLLLERLECPARSVMSADPLGARSGGIAAQIGLMLR
jgi:hypothetical protein